jgi:chromate transporter
MNATAPVQEVPPETAQREPYSLRAFLLYFLRLGALGFGGPIALAGYMQRDLVETRGWIEKKDYDEGLALAQLSPGPLAAQLAIYLGWLGGRVLGAALVSVAFISPSFVMVVGLSALYVSFGGLPWMQGAFYGVGAAVIAIIGRSANNLLKKTLKRDALLWAIAAVNATTTALTRTEVVWLVVLGGFATLGIRFRSSATPLAGFAPLPLVWGSGLHGPVASATLWKVLAYFATAGIFVFGSGLAIVPFLHGGVVDVRHWLTEQQFLDAVAVAMITPGPVVITVAFIGYLVAGPLGAERERARARHILASIGVFAPCFFIVVLAAPHYRRFAGKGRVKAFVEGVTAGAVGAIAGAVVVLARKSLVDPISIGIALVSLMILLRVKKLPEPLLILGAALVGVAVKTLHK